MENIPKLPSNDGMAQLSRAALIFASGLVPVIGGAFAAAAAIWSEEEQAAINEFLKYRQEMLEKEIAEQLQVICEVLKQLKVLQKDVSQRVQSAEFQSLVQKCFKDWSGINSAEKRQYVKNILINAASSNVTSDEVIRLFIDWLSSYSDLHFKVISCIYQHHGGIGRGAIWAFLGKQKVREDSAEADLYKLLIRDLSTGGIIRQYRQTDYAGNFLPTKKTTSPHNTAKMTSAFEDTEKYVLTELGSQFVHYAISEVTTKIESKS